MVITEISRLWKKKKEQLISFNYSRKIQFTLQV